MALGIGASLLLHALTIPAGAAVYYDEHLHAEATANIAARLSPHPCCAYEGGRCVEGGPIMWPLATHVASAMVLLAERGHGVRDAAQARASFNRFASAAAPLLAFAWVFLLLGESLPAALAGLALALWPGVVRLQTTGDLSPGAVFFLTGLLCALEWLRQRPTWSATTCVVGLFALTCHSRLELALVTPWVLWRSRDVRIGRVPAWVLIAIAWPIIVAPLAWMYVEGARAHTEGWNPGLGNSLAFLRAHLPGNLLFFLNPEVSFPGLALLAVVGLLAPAGRRLIPLALTAGGLLVFISAYHIGAFGSADGEGFRYAMTFVVLMLPFAAAAMSVVLRTAFSNTALDAVALAAIILVPLRWQSHPPPSRPAAQLDQLIRASLSRHDPGDLFVTRSVAYTRSVTGADNIVERCSAAPSKAEHAFYLRSWDDDGPAQRPGMCAAPQAFGLVSRHGFGPWLYRYGPCAATAGAE